MNFSKVQFGTYIYFVANGKTCKKGKLIVHNNKEFHFEIDKNNIFTLDTNCGCFINEKKLKYFISDATNDSLIYASIEFENYLPYEIEIPIKIKFVDTLKYGLEEESLKKNNEMFLPLLPLKNQH